jgi:tetratricopeptide (TPR) repeat protein
MASLDEARALLERAEREPLLGNRVAPVQAAIDAAAVALDEIDAPELRARLLLRLAQVKLAETDFDGADAALHAVAEHVPDHAALRFLTGVRACRVALRRGPKERETARGMLLASAARIPQLAVTDPIWQRVTSEIVLGAAEVGIHDEPVDMRAFEALRALVDELTRDPAELDLVFTGTQLIAAYALALGDGPRALAAFRALVKMARAIDAPADEIEARLALAGVLVELGDPIGLEEAAHHVQHARDRALEHGLASLHQAALIAQAGVMSRQGKTAGAVDRMLELARSAAADQDVPRYVAAVAMMAELYARGGDAVSAYRTIVESHRALADATGSDATPLFRPLLAALRDRVGAERLRQIAADVARANELADQLADKT